MGRYSTSANALDRVVEAPRVEAAALATALAPERNRVLYWLLVLNILLQIFDGIATYSGLHLGIREGNPLLRSVFHAWGVVPTLLVLKANASVLLLFIYGAASEQHGELALTVLACVYLVCSFVPWLGMFLAVLVRLG
jgi:hypothetical protein